MYLTYSAPAPTDLRRQLRHDLLQLNRAVAGYLGLDARLTISSNLALAISRTFNVPFATAKLWFHSGVAGFVSLLLRFAGLSSVVALGVGSFFLYWLEGFDTSRQRQ